MRAKMDPLALDLVGKLLVYSPTVRMTPMQALQHPYFDELRDENSLKMLQLKKVSVPDLFDF
jgi:glycogen synthase kinase 3 beta